MNAFRTYAALVTVQLLFGMWPVVGTAAMEVVPPRALVGIRTLIGAPIMFALVALTGRSLRVSGRDLLVLAGLAALGVSANQLLFIEGLKRAGPINATVLTVLIPVSTILVATALGREPAVRRRFLGVAIAVVGVAILVRAERFDLSSARLQGSLLILANTTLYGTYLVLARPVIARLGAFVVVAWVFVFGAIEAAPFTLGPLLSVQFSSLSTNTWMALAFILIGPTILTYFLNAYALRRVDSSVVAVFVGLQPLVGAIGAYVLLDTAISARAATAAMVIIAGVLLTSFTPRSRAA